MTGRDDPSGRRALWGPAAGGEADPGAPTGRAALWSTPQGPPDGDAGLRAPAGTGPTGTGPAGAGPTGAGAAPWSVVVDCGRCGRRSVLDPVGATRRLAASLWWPLHRPSRYLRCPACGRWAWCRVRPGLLAALR